MKKLMAFLLCLAFMAALALPASALEYTVDAPTGPEYGRPTSIEPVITVDRGEMQKDSTGNQTQWLPVEKEEQGSERSFRRQAETELNGLCDDAV